MSEKRDISREISEMYSYGDADADVPEDKDDTEAGSIDGSTGGEPGKQLGGFNMP